MRVLARVGMAEAADRPCSALAYGDVKRVELAVALAASPSLLLMDEPTAGMAPARTRRAHGLAADRWRAAGIGVLFTEHDMDVVFGHADRVLVLLRGADHRRGLARGDRARSAACGEAYLGDRMPWRGRRRGPA